MAKKKKAASKAEVYDGWYVVDSSAFIYASDMVWNRTHKDWLYANNRQQGTRVGTRRVIREMPKVKMPEETAAPVEPPKADLSPERQAQLDLQARIQNAMTAAKTDRKVAEVEVIGRSTASFAATGGCCESTDISQHAHLVSPEEFVICTAKHPLFSQKNDLGVPPDGLTVAEQRLYKSYLLSMGDAERQKLYQLGGFQAVRDAVMVLVKNALKPEAVQAFTDGKFTTQVDGNQHLTIKKDGRVIFEAWEDKPVKKHWWQFWRKK